MPRKALISHDEFVDKAMLLYWIKGYTGVSVDQLTKETGASKAMIYKKTLRRRQIRKKKT